MPVMRVNKTKDYTVMSNSHFKNKEMSLKAKGLLSLMLSLPDEWDYSIAGLVSICKENESAIKSTLDELKKLGYLIVTKKMPNETETGRIEYVYDIYEQPTEKQAAEKQGVENLGVEFQGVENQGQSNTNTSNTKETNIHKVIKAFPCLKSFENFNDELLDTLQSFADMRKKLKSPMTEKAMELLISKLHNLTGGNVQTMIEVLNQSIMNGWKSVYPLKNEPAAQNGSRIDWIDNVPLD